MKKSIIRATRSIYSPPGLSYIPWLIMLPFSILGTGAFVPEGTSVGEPNWMIVGLLAHLVLLPMIFVGNLIAKASKFRFGLILIATLVLMGLARGFTVSTLAEQFDLVEQANFAWRMGTGTFLVVVWYAVGNAAVFEINSFTKTLSKLKTELAKQSKYLEQSEDELGRSRSEVLQETLKLVDLGLIQVETKGKESRELQKISNELHRLVDQGLRPIIDRLQLSSTKPEFVVIPYQKVNGWQVATTAFIERPFHIAVAIVLQMISAITAKVWGFGFVGAVLDLLLVGTAIFISYTIGKWVLSKLENQTAKLISNLSFLMIPAFVSSVSPLIVLPGSELTLIAAMSLFNNVFAAGMLSAVGFASKYEYEQAIERLKLAIDQTALARSRAEQLRLVEKQRLARILHGTVQSRIRSLALEIERTGVAPDSQRLSQFRTAIETELKTPSSINLVEFLDQLKEMWGASAEISCSLDPETVELLANDQNAHVAVVEIVREVVSNAMKHSDSKKVSFKIGRYHAVSESLGIIMVSAEFDGTEISDTKPGYGMKTISELSTHFSYHSDSKGNHFSAEVPVSNQLILATTGT